MRTLIRSITILLGLLSVAICAVADVYQKGPGFEYQTNHNAITLLFVNGIRNTDGSNNTPPQVEDSADALIKSLQANGLPQLTYNLEYFYNQTDGLIDDTGEVFRQAAISNLFFAGGSYYASLGSYYNSQYAVVDTLSGVQWRVVAVAAQLKKNIEDILTSSAGLIIVPHSQGNLYVEAAYSMLFAEGKTALLSKIRVVGVASAAATTPSGRYITHTSDAIIGAEGNLVAPLLSSFKPLAPNETACETVLQVLLYCGAQIPWITIDLKAHGFQEVYLNKSVSSQSSGRTFPRIIYDFVVVSLGELEAGIAPTPTQIQVDAGDLVYMYFRLDKPFTGTPTQLRGGLRLVGGFPQSTVTVSLFNGPTLLGTTQWGNENVFGWAFMSQDSGWMANLQVDFSSIRDRSIDGVFLITTGTPYTFDPTDTGGIGTVVDLTDCRGDSSAACNIVGRGTITGITVKQVPR